jgi:hypothetical protein
MDDFSDFDESSGLEAAEYIGRRRGDKPKGGRSMRPNAAALLLVAALGGCTSYQSGPDIGGMPHWGRTGGPPVVPGLKGPYGEGVALAAPYDSSPPPNAQAARYMMNQNVPLSAVQLNPYGGPAGAPPGVLPNGAMPRGPVLAPPGVPFGPGVPMPGGPAQGGFLPTGGVQPANMPMAGGVINANIPPGRMPPGGLMQLQMAQANPAAAMRFQGQRTQIRFVRPSGMKVSWFTQTADGRTMFSTTPVEAPGRYNFPQAAIYRLKLSNIEGRPGLEVYPTMEVVPANPKTEAFLAHSAVPVEFTPEDFKQIAEGNYLVKVIYLPDPQFQDVASTGTDELLSTSLPPGADPIQEALRRGCILVVLRMGNVDQEAPNTPPLNAPAQHAAAPVMIPTGPAQPGVGMPPSYPPAFLATRPGTPPGQLPVPPMVPPNTLPGSMGDASRGSPAEAPGLSSTNKFLTPPATLPNAGTAFPPAAGNIEQPSIPDGASQVGPNVSGPPPQLNRATPPTGKTDSK